VASVPIPKGCLEVGPSIVGIKVYLVQKALGLVGHREIYDRATVTAVTSFQRRHHLAPTGRVNETTWNALRTGYPFCVDRFTRQPTVAPAAKDSAHAAAAIAFARAQLRRPYIWGGAGPMGYDCSGLSLQAMYAGGRVVPGVTTDKHVQATYRTAAAIYASPALVHAPLSKRRAGDLVFWGNDFHHMAIYLGGDTIVEAVRPGVRTASLWSHGTPRAIVVRPFA
jgi:cell wall-associated NlpC family hydrolase